MRALSLLLLLTLATTATAQTTRPAGDIAPLGINLETVDYDYPVQWHRFESQRQQLTMAYMDIAPTGDSNGKTVVLLHGKNFSGDYWGPTATDLADAGFRVVVPDQIGFGKSTKPEHYHFTFQTLAQNTAGLLDELGVGNVHVVGHSMGGMLATRFALMYPDRTDRLALVNPIGLEDWKTIVPYRPVEAWYQSELNKTAEGIRKYQFESYYDGQWDPAYDRAVELLAGPLHSPDWPRMAWVQALTYDMIFTQPVVHEFGNLSMPTLIMVGTRDRTALGKDAVDEETRATMGRYDQLGQTTADAIPDAELIELDDVGHMPMLEAYDRYIGPLTEFLAEG